MDRYQFEDAISAYLENELSLSERQAFETYMNANPDAKELVECNQVDNEIDEKFTCNQNF